MSPEPEARGFGPDIRRDYDTVRLAQQLFAKVWAPAEYVDAELPTEAGPIPVRKFAPEERTGHHTLLFFHGGGWAIGSVDSYSRICASLAEATGCPVWSVDYRLAPEHPFPAPLDDCFHSARAVLQNPGLVEANDPSEIVLVGDSAGANLAAVTSLLLRDEGVALPGAQILFYPVTQTDHDLESSPFESVREHGNRWFPRAVDLQGFVEMYAPSDKGNWRVAPLHAPNLHEQPRTLVITAGWDPLRDEGEAYGEALTGAGNDVRIERIERALHGFLSLPRFARPVSSSHDLVNDFLCSSVKMGS